MAYDEISVLNQGSYGTVSLVQDRRTGRRFASKRLASEDWWCKCKCLNEARHEARVRALLKHHPNIVRLENVEGDELVYEYCPRGDLYEACCKAPIRPMTVRAIMLQLCDAVTHCHQRGVCHRDIKPENILVGMNGTYKLADFGFSSIGRWCTDFGTGSPGYMAPECFSGTDKYDAEAADVWSVGICLVRLLFNRSPWKQATDDDKHFVEYRAERETLFDVYEDLSRDIYDALGHALHCNPKMRSLAKFQAALESAQVWTTRDELLRLSYKSPGFHHHVGSYEYWPQDKRLDRVQSRSRSNSTASQRSQQDIFDLDEDFDDEIFDMDQTLAPDRVEGLHGTLQNIPDPQSEPPCPELGLSPATGSNNSDIIAAPASLPARMALSCSWADLDEDFHPSQPLNAFSFK